MISINQYLKSLTLFYIVTSLWGIWGQRVSQEFFYAVTVIYFLLFLIGIGLTGTLQINKWTRKDIVAVLMIGVWIYGILVGLIKGNNKVYIIRNFAGLALYVTMFFIKRGNVETSRVQKAILVSSVLQMILIPIAYVAVNYGFSALFYKVFVPLGIGTNVDTDMSISIWANNPNLVFVIYCFCLYKCIYERKWFSKYTLLVVFCAIMILYCARSGGILLELLGLTALMIWSSIKQKAKRWSVAVYGIIFFVGIIVLYKPLSVLFDIEDDTNNQTRLIQIKYIFSHLSFFGHGLGAEYTAIGKDYGIEVIYLDLVYKFGIFSLVIIGIYIYTVISAVKLLMKSSDNAYDCLPLSLMGFLFVAAGNPILYAGPSVISHVIALELLENKRENRYNTQGREADLVAFR